MTPDRRWLLFAAVLLADATVILHWVHPDRPLWPMGVATTAMLAVVAVAVYSIRSGLFGPVAVGGPPDGDAVALTFDDGPHPDHTRAIADQLAQRGHRATFFVVGRRGARHPEVLAGLVEAGHEVAIHSYEHGLRQTVPSMAWLRSDLDRCVALLQQTTGQRPLYFRPPFGLLNPRLLRAAEAAELTIVGWTLRTLDGVETTPARVVERVERRLRPGDVVLMHDRIHAGAPAAVEALPGVLDAIERRGLRSVTLSSLAAGRPAAPEATP